jgi:hypothetical protein
MRSLVVLALPGAIFGFLTRIPPPVFDSLDFGLTIDEPWLDALAALVLAAAVALLVAIIVFVLLLLGLGSSPRDRRARR